MSSGQVRREVDALVANLSAAELAGWRAGTFALRLENGWYVVFDAEPGHLWVNGSRCYSAAWL